MATTDTAKRDAFITGLRDLADYLSTHPGVPVPVYRGEISVCCADEADYGGSDEVNAAADALAATVSIDDNGTHSTRRSFGPVQYKVFAVSSEAMDRYYAETSYHGCVKPDKAA
jgi:hypothetical protein